MGSTTGLKGTEHFADVIEDFFLRKLELLSRLYSDSVNGQIILTISFDLKSQDAALSLTDSKKLSNWGHLCGLIS